MIPTFGRVPSSASCGTQNRLIRQRPPIRAHSCSKFHHPAPGRSSRDFDHPHHPDRSACRAGAAAAWPRRVVRLANARRWWRGVGKRAVSGRPGIIRIETCRRRTHGRGCQLARCNRRPADRWACPPAKAPRPRRSALYAVYVKLYRWLPFTIRKSPRTARDRSGWEMGKRDAGESSALPPQNMLRLG